MGARIDIDAALAQWPDYLGTLAGAGELLDLLPDPADAQARQELYRLLFLSLGTGFMTAFADPDHPDFVAAVHTVFNASSTNPDFLYLQASVDGAGIYRITGVRGTALFVHGDIAAGGLGVMDELGPSVGQFDLDALDIQTDGSFEILLSADRPSGYDGNWVRLDPRARTIVLRQASYDWGREIDGRFTIERVDRPLKPARLSAAETASPATARRIPQALRGAMAQAHGCDALAPAHQPVRGRRLGGARRCRRSILLSGPVRAETRRSIAPGIRPARALSLLEHAIVGSAVERSGLAQPAEQSERAPNTSRRRRPSARGDCAAGSGNSQLAGSGRLRQRFHHDSLESQQLGTSAHAEILAGIRAAAASARRYSRGVAGAA